MQITTLFVTESAPIGGTFFYYGDGHLGRCLQRSIEEVFAGGGGFLARFQNPTNGTSTISYWRQ